MTSKREVFDPRQSQLRTFNSKQEVFNEQTVYLETFFEGALFQTPNSFITGLIFPHRRYDDINFGWDYMNFPAFPAVRTAQHAPPVKLGYETRSGSATMSRYALSVEGLDEDQRSNLGKTVMTGLLASMAHGFLSMFELNGFRAIFKEPAIYQKFFFESQMYDVNMNRKLQVELTHFDIIRRSDTGFQDLVDMVQQEFRDTQRLVVTDAIIPTGARSIMSKGDKMRQYYLRGENNQQYTDLQGDAPSLQNNISALTIHVARSYYFDGAGVEVNPMRRKIMIGDFGIQDNVVGDCHPSLYCTSQVEPSMFSVTDNKFMKLSIEWLIHWNNRFDRTTKRLAQEHYDIANKNYKLASNLGVPVPDRRLDMFVYSSLTTKGEAVFNVASHWGHMEDWALMDHVVDGIGKTSTHQLKEAIGEKAVEALDNGMKLKRQIRNKTPTDLDIRFINVAAPPPTASGETIAKRGNLYGAQQLPTKAELAPDFDRVTGYIPIGYSTFGSLMTLGREASTSEEAYGYIAESVRTTSAAFADAAERAKEFYEALYPNHIALNPNSVPSVYRSSDTGEEGRNINALLAFGYNIIDDVDLPLYVGVRRTATAGLPATFDDFYAAKIAADAELEVFRPLATQMLAGGAPLQVQQVFGNSAGFDAFKRKFDGATPATASPFSKVYAAKLLDDRQRAAGQRVRTLRTGPGATDDEEAAARAQSGARSAFVQFQANEIIGRNLSGGEAARVWSRVIDYVNSGTAPAVLTNADIGAWVRSDADAAALGTGFQSATRSADAYLTRLSLPFDKVGTRAELLIASPLNIGVPLDKATAGTTFIELQKNAAADLAPIFSTARAGTRTQTDTVPAPSQPAALFGLSTAQPTFAAALFQDAIPDARGDGKTYLVVNENMRRRWREAGKNANIQQRIARRMFLSAPITSDVCVNMAAKNIVLPFAHLVLRPHKQYWTEAIIFMSMSASTPIGFTASHDPRVNYVSNGTTEKFFIHVVLYTETILMRGERILIVPDGRVAGCVSGDNLVPFTPSTYNPEALRDGTTMKSPSVIVVMQPAGSLFGKYRYVGRRDAPDAQEDMFGSVIDIRGFFGAIKQGNMGGSATRPREGADSSLMRLNGSEPEPRSLNEEWPHYSSALFTNFIYPFKNLKTVGRLRGCKLKAMENFDNTMCLQARQKFCIGFGASTPTAQIQGKDHFADSTEDGCAARRCGTDNKPYSDIYRDLPILTH
jgi:hypothetical protein